MSIISKIQEILDERGITAAQMSRDLGFSSGLFSQWKRRAQEPRKKSVEAIAEYLDISYDWLLSEENREAAAEKYGICMDYKEREALKTRCRQQNSDKNVSLTDAVENAIGVMQALFSRSLEASSYSLDHPDFDTYCAMLLDHGLEHNRHFGDLSDEMYKKVYAALVKRFGTKKGIPSGTTYQKTNDVTKKASRRRAPVATPRAATDEELMFALFDGTEGVTDEMYEEVKAFAKSLKEREAHKNDV